MISDYLKSTSFCVLPFIHQEKKFNGTYHICCYGDQLQSDNKNDNDVEAFNSLKMKKLRHDMLNEVKNQACQSCYNQEEKSISSPRQRENFNWINWIDSNDAILNSITKFQNNKILYPISYDIRYSNTCTLKCRMCNSSSSSAINNEYKKINYLWPNKFWTIDNPRINHDLHIHNEIKKIYLAGGEPLVEPYNILLLEKLAEQNNDLQLIINTSLSNLSDKFINLFNKFKNILFAVSLDGTSNINNYIRHGSNFDTVILNIRKLQNYEILITTCVSMYNLFNIKDLVNFINNNFPEYKNNHTINLVNDIDELKIENLPYELRPELISSLESLSQLCSPSQLDGLKNVISILSDANFTNNKFQSFIKYTKILDNLRGESINLLIPQYQKYFDE